MFVDRVKIKVRGGRGGRGCRSFLREKRNALGGPDGGDGGMGGNVVFRAVPGQQSLVDLYYMPHFEAKDGGHGKSKDGHGRNGLDRVIEVPIGTLIRDAVTDELLADLCVAGQECFAAKGGKGGLGNTRFTSSLNRAPQNTTPGTEGEERELRLELKTVADVGLVGYPNAGKSTLISAVSDARPKTAPYPFTTLHPVVGVVEFPDYWRMSIADIPGLIDGAHLNIGLGHEFLRHIERCRILVYVLDTAGVDQRKPWDDLEALHRELELHQPGLSDRAVLILANKMDLPEAAANLAELRTRTQLPIRPISALGKEHVEELLGELRARLTASVTPVPPAAAGEPGNADGQP
jgi:GTPase